MTDAAPPPSYEQATGSSTSSQPGVGSSSSAHASSHLIVPGADGPGSIPAAHRRSMEDEARPLPSGWVRSYDPQNSHQFFVDTTKDPPRSIWHHPYDDDEYINSLSGAERERVEQESINYKRSHPPSKEDYIHAPSDDEDDDYLPQQYQNQSAGPGPGSASSASNAQLPPRPDAKVKEKVSFGRKLKDKVTGLTHEEREAQRRQREEEERRAYEMHIKVRQAMQRAAQTGQPQLIGKNRDGKEVYIEPPRPPYQGGGFGMSGGYGYSPYSPYNSNGIYTTPNAQYVRPGVPYARPFGSPYGYGGRMYGRPYGSGMGMPLAGGLLGGALLGGLLF